MPKFTVVAPGFVSVEVNAASPAEAGREWLKWRSRNGELALSHGVRVLQIMDEGKLPQVIDQRGKLVGEVTLPRTGRPPIL
jgi:hypothetical protein